MTTELGNRIRDIKKVFDVKDIVSMPSDKEAVRNYYQANRIPYTIFHTSTGMTHMGISRNGIYKEDDLIEAARIVSKNITEIGAANVLELATGRGANSIYLAKRFQNCQFVGIDISPAQLSFAKKKAKIVNNYFPSILDYHDLGAYKKETFDLVFIVEALCHSIDKKRVIEEVYRVLRPGGRFIIFDGYLSKQETSLSEEEKLICDLVEKGMAVADFENYLEFKKIALSKFKLHKEEDFSLFVIPTMERFAKIGKKFISHPWGAKIISSLLPKSIVFNAVAGYLMPETMRQGVYCYMLTVLVK